MSALTDQLKADVQGAQADLPVSFVFNGKTYAGQRDETRDARDMQDAGFLQSYDFELTAIADIFDTAPAVNEEIQIASVTYRIAGKITSPDGVVIRFACVAAN